ncbi:MAG: hypothetical protein AMXMBFR84_06680 [Candidatus Hydrogenedentota bacterium]
MNRETTILLNVVLILILLGTLMVYSANSVNVYDNKEFDGTVSPHYLIEQLIKVVVGFAVMILAARFDYHNYLRLGVRGMLVIGIIGLLVLTLFISEEIRGGRRWINLGGFTLQASELAKLVLIIVLSAKLAHSSEKGVRFFTMFIPAVLWTALFGGLVFMQQDLGTPVVMGACMMILLFVAGAPLWQLGLIVTPGIVGFIAAIIQEPYRLERVRALFDPWAYRSSEGGMQLIESISGFARGSMWGKGLGAGEQKLNFLPDAHSDFIFSVWGEEMGLAGSIILVFLFVTLLVVGRRIALSAPDTFGTLLAAGIVFLVTLQAGLNMGVVTGLLPTKGLALPFISEGGSSLLANMLSVGVLFNIAVQCEVHESARRPVAA